MALNIVGTTVYYCFASFLFFYLFIRLNIWALTAQEPIRLDTSQFFDIHKYLWKFVVISNVNKPLMIQKQKETFVASDDIKL